MTARGPIRRRSRYGAVVLVVVVLATGGCSGADGPRGSGSSGAVPTRGQDPSDLGTVALPNPLYVPITGASGATAVPGPLPARPDPSALSAAAGAGRTRLDGERYALLAAQTISDTRDERRGGEVIDEIASPLMAPALRAFLIQDASGQREINSRRHIDTAQEIWLRSSVVTGTDQIATRVDTEVVANYAADLFDLHAWALHRVDVISLDGQWSVIDYSSNGFGPQGSKPLTPRERKKMLVGTGWRRIAPAGG